MLDWRIAEEDSKRDLGRGEGGERGYLDEVQTRDQVQDVGSIYVAKNTQYLCVSMIFINQTVPNECLILCHMNSKQ